jgi:hypothetical protein
VQDTTIQQPSAENRGDFAQDVCHGWLVSSLTEGLPQDVAVRAMTEDGSFRVVAVDATRTARAIIEAQAAEGSDAQHLAELTARTAPVASSSTPNPRDERAGS